MTAAETIAHKWESERVEVDSIEIRYLRTGEGGKPPLVCLHGLMAGGACLTPLARLLQSSFDVIMPDARGHGDSSAPRTGYAYDDHAQDVVGLIRALALDRPVLLGHSMGGMTAAVVASRMGTAIDALVLVDPTFISAAWQREVHESDIRDQHREFLASDWGELMAQARLRHPHRSHEILTLLTAARMRTSPEALEVLRPPNPDFRELVRGLGVPVLLLLAENGVVPLDIAYELQRLNPLLSHTLIPDAGHGLPYDKPDQLADAVLTYLCAAGRA